MLQIKTSENVLRTLCLYLRGSLSENDRSLKPEFIMNITIPDDQHFKPV